MKILIRFSVVYLVAVVPFTLVDIVLRCSSKFSLLTNSFQDVFVKKSLGLDC